MNPSAYSLNPYPVSSLFGKPSVGINFLFFFGLTSHGRHAVMPVSYNNDTKVNFKYARLYYHLLRNLYIPIYQGYLEKIKGIEILNWKFPLKQLIFRELRVSAYFLFLSLY